MPRFPVILVALAFTAACHSAPPAPVPLAGTPGGFAALAGEWAGSYESQQTGRSGSIVFSLESGEDHAHGDVTMIPRGTNTPLRAARVGSADNGPMPAQLLNIRFVRATGDMVSGAMEPYMDPECGCSAATTFEGHQRGNTIDGTFTTMRSDRTTTTSGTWTVTRRR
jgi:hypothetical protein